MQIQLPKSLRTSQVVTMPPLSRRLKAAPQPSTQMVAYRQMVIPKKLRSKPKPRARADVSFSTNTPVAYSSQIRPLLTRSVQCPSIGSEPGFGFVARGVSSLFTVTTSSGVQSTQDQFAQVQIRPTSAWSTSSVTDPVASAGGYLTGAVADTISSVFAGLWPKRMTLKWIPVLPTSASGDVAISVSVNTVGGITANPTDISQMMSQSTSIMGSAFKPLSLSWSPGPTPKRLSELYGNSGGSPFGFIAPTVFVGFSGIASGAGSTVSCGRIEAEVEWQLYGPGIITDVN